MRTGKYSKSLIVNLYVHFNVDVRRIAVVRIMLAVGFLTPHLLNMNPNRWGVKNPTAVA